MSTKFIRSILFAWLILAALTVGFGAFREMVFIPRSGLNDTLARAVLLPIALAYTYLVAWWLLKRVLGEWKYIDTWKMGSIWLLLTIAFEFSFGHFVMGHSWQHLLADYNILEGRTWGFFLAWLMLSPPLAAMVLTKDRSR